MQVDTLWIILELLIQTSLKYTTGALDWTTVEADLNLIITKLMGSTPEAVRIANLASTALKGYVALYAPKIPAPAPGVTEVINGLLDLQAHQIAFTQAIAQAETAIGIKPTT